MPRATRCASCSTTCNTGKCDWPVCTDTAHSCRTPPSPSPPPLAAASPHLRGLFRGRTADSKAWEIELQQIDGRALQQIVDFAYTGKIELAGSTVVAIIQTANLLQVTAVEAAAVEFLADRLDLENCLDSRSRHATS